VSPSETKRLLSNSEQAPKRRKVVVDVEAWQPPIHVDDFNVKAHPVALGERCARVALVEQSSKRSHADIQVSPLQLRNARLGRI